MAKKDYKKLSDDIIAACGGVDNILSASHCMTRLRMNLKDASVLDVEEAKKAYEDMVAKQAENEMLEVAKKYIILGKKPEELSGTLQTLKKSGDAAYNAYIEALDAQVDMVNKSGIFGEVGKSTHADVGTYDEAYAKSETLAKSIAAEKGITMEQAMVQVWETNPDLANACAN